MTTLNKTADRITADDRSDNVVDMLERTHAADLFERLNNRKNPYLTSAATMARDDLRQRLPAKYAHKAARVLSDVSNSFPNHNVLTLAAALAYADEGLHVIDSHALGTAGVGTGPGGQVKIPRGTKWQARASVDHAEITSFWTGDGNYPADKNGSVYPFAPPPAYRNVSISFPPDCDLFVMDIDGDAGKAALAEMEAEHGALPVTWESITGSGGYHLIFRANGADIRNTASSIAPGVDIRGSNGQIIAPPSIHPNGKFYRWDDGRAPWECSVADAPDWLVKLSFEATKGRGEEVSKTKGKAKTGKRKSSASARQGVNAIGFEAHLETIGDGEGQRGFDAPIYSAACSFFSEHGSDANGDDIFDILRATIAATEMKDDQARKDRYMFDDDYLTGRIEQAREFIAARQVRELTDKVQFEAAEDWMPKGYVLGTDMIFFQEANGDEIASIPVCGVFDVVGRTADSSGTEGAGRIISFENENGIRTELTLDRASLYANGPDVLRKLADAGLPMEAGTQKANDRLLNLLRRMTPKRLVPTLHKPGWHGEGFMMPTGHCIGGDAVRLHEDATVKVINKKGTLEGWQGAANAALSHVEDNPYWALTLCAGFAGPLLDMLEWNPVGFVLSGGTSKGKSLGQTVAASIWTTPQDGKGVFWTASSTPNAYEDLAIYGSGTCLMMDELGAITDKRQLAPLIFVIHTGRGKARKRGNGPGLTRTSEFRPFVVFSSESNIKAEIEAAGVPYRGGMAVRFPDVDVGSGRDRTTAEIAKIEAVQQNYGYAGEDFIHHLMDRDNSNLAKEVQTIVDTLADGRTPGIRRAARPFALAQRAGELAFEAGLLDELSAVRRGVLLCWESFLKSDEAATANGSESMLDSFRSWIGSEMDRTILAACAPDKDDRVQGITPDNHDARGRVIGWYTPDTIYLDWKQLETLQIPGSFGKRAALCNALADIEALDRSSASNIPYTNLPEFVASVSDGVGRTTKNMRIKRKEFGV
ncbi:DUF927 domain-containing protein [Aliiroseovarius sp. S1339]|uniref:DUF927 domain-containing protein n=1 Tax=Aliiroseovarius sp. S1339 TaxID=2936990 RepID=UPI0020BD5912|nr:DUF927 domain-containing protein [Aliiroseovarius sp. S1339]MCK8462405.1 DUF927 domain-containing protein [Aliiroseovarius sp. S1339]